MRRCKIFDIPNTLLAIWAGFGSGPFEAISKATVHWDDFIAALKAKGLMVIQRDDLNPATMGALVRKMTKDRELFGVYLWAHGTFDGIMLGRKEFTYTRWRSDEKYHLGLGLLFACFSETAKEKVFSKNALFRGAHGILSPFPRPPEMAGLGVLARVNPAAAMSLQWAFPTAYQCNTFFDDFPGINEFLKPLDQ